METCQNKQDDKVATPTIHSGYEEPSPQEVEMEESVRIAFAQPLLLEMILEYAMDENRDLCPDNIRKLRLVQKNWKEAVSKKLRDNKEPLYRLKLHKMNSLMSSRYVEANGKLLDEFVNYWTIGKGAKDIMPTFHLELRKEYFRQENYDSFLNCVRKCGAGLTGIVLELPVRGGSLPGILSNVRLPVIQILVIYFTGMRLEISGESEIAVNHSSNVTFLFQSLLNKNESLKQLTLTSDNWNKLHSFPGAQYITLPITLTNIKIDFCGAEKILELLTRNHLPKLRALTLGVSCGISVSTELLFQIFENVRKTLRHLEFVGQDCLGPPRVPNLLRFPVMDELQSLGMNRVYFELEVEIPMFEALFPKLEELALCHQTPQTLQKWTTGSASNLLEHLSLELIDENLSQEDLNTLPLTLEVIQGAHQRFTNICSLRLRISGTETSGLKYVFMEMGQLTQLHIDVVGIESSVTSDHWDSVLIGAPVGFVVGMATCPKFWGQVKLENGEEPSIRNLKELKAFILKEIDNGDTSRSPCILNLVFVYGFLKMPKLNYLCFEGNVSVSVEMASEWKKTGRAIYYSE